MAMEHDIDLATELLRLGIERLGYSYHNDKYIDDTSQKLGLAHFKYDEGELVTSAALYISVLESRLEMLDMRDR